MVVRLEKNNELWDIFGAVAYNGKDWGASPYSRYV